MPIGTFHQYIRDYDADNDESWKWIRNMMRRMGVRRDSQNHNYVLGAK